MKNLQLTDEIKMAFDSVNLPEIDVTDAVMDSIRKPGPRYFRKKTTIVYAVLAAVILVTTTAFAAAAKMWVLKGNNDNIVLRLREFDVKPFDTSKDPELEKWYESLEPGKALVYYNANLKKPNSVILSIYPKPVVYTDLDLIREKSGFNFKVPPILPEGFEFLEGELVFEPVGIKGYGTYTELLDSLIEETEKTGRESAMLEWETTSKVLGVNLVYRNNDKEFKVCIGVWPGEDVYTDLDNLNVEVIKINDREVLYTEDDEGDREVTVRELYGKKTTRFYNGRKFEDGMAVSTYLQYKIISRDLPKEDLLLVAQGIIE